MGVGVNPIVPDDRHRAKAHTGFHHVAVPVWRPALVFSNNYNVSECTLSLL